MLASVGSVSDEESMAHKYSPGEAADGLEESGITQKPVATAIVEVVLPLTNILPEGGITPAIRLPVFSGSIRAVRSLRSIDAVYLPPAK